MRLMIDIARQGEAGALVTMRQAAEREDLSVKYLEQLGGALVVGGCVTAAALALYVVSERAAVRGYATRDL